MSIGPTANSPRPAPEIEHATCVFLESINRFALENTAATGPQTVLVLSIIRYIRPPLVALDGILNPDCWPRTPVPHDYGS